MFRASLVIYFLGAAHAFCPIGEQADFNLPDAPCVPVTCDSRQACQDQLCVPSRRVCEAEPCAQFTCSDEEPTDTDITGLSCDNVDCPADQPACQLLPKECPTGELCAVVMEPRCVAELEVSCATCESGSYNDGCNTCHCSEDGTAACTMMACFAPGKPFCIKPEPEEPLTGCEDCTPDQICRVAPCLVAPCTVGFCEDAVSDCGDENPCPFGQRCEVEVAPCLVPPCPSSGTCVPDDDGILPECKSHGTVEASCADFVSRIRVSCVGSPQCGPKGECVWVCDSDAACAAVSCMHGQICKDGICYDETTTFSGNTPSTCDADTPCQPGQKCEVEVAPCLVPPCPSFGTCVPDDSVDVPCKQDADCGDCMQCTEGQCVVSLNCQTLKPNGKPNPEGDDLTSAASIATGGASILLAVFSLALATN